MGEKSLLFLRYHYGRGIVNAIAEIFFGYPKTFSLNFVYLKDLQRY